MPKHLTWKSRGFFFPKYMQRKTDKKKKIKCRKQVIETLVYKNVLENIIFKK